MREISMTIGSSRHTPTNNRGQLKRMTNYHTSGMTLISPDDCIWSQSTRMVILEKQIPIELKFYDANNPPDYLLELNPNALSGTLIDKKLILYHVTIIMEYLEERFPQPALNKMDPISKANNRMIIKRVSEDWCQLLENILYHCEKPEPPKKMLTEISFLQSHCFEQKNTS